ncbi:MFS transporter [Patescibacteria group bacterium]|nr:MFS transporter [Patescibacteria group bacterium]
MKLNSIIKYLTIADFALLSGFSLIAPIFAVYILDNIKGGNLEIVGIATAINILFKVVFQLPIARYLDKKKGDLDEYYFTIIGSAFLAVSPLFYLIISTPTELYAVQAFYGISLAMNYPGWMSLFTRHAEKERESSQWAIYSSITGIGSAAAAALGGFIGERYGFNLVFWLVFFITVLGTVSLVKIYPPLKLRHEHYKMKEAEAFEIKKAEMK